MKYKYLSEVGDSEKLEEGTSGHRRPALEGSAIGALQPAILALKGALEEQKRLRQELVRVTAGRAQSSSAAAAFARYDPGSAAKVDGGRARAGATPSVRKAPIAVVASGGGRQRSGGVGDDKNLARKAVVDELAQVQQALADADANAQHYREWLELEGVTLDGDGNIVAGLDYKVVYDHDPSVQSMHKVDIVGGLLQTNAMAKQRLSTKGMVTHFSGPGYAIYVMSQSGGIYVSSHSVGYRHHSSLLAGAQVACAGELKVEDGRITWLSNKSGHYHPSKRHLVQVLHQLQKQGVNMDFRLSVMGPGTRDDYLNVGDFVRYMESIGGDYDKMKLNAYEARGLLDPAVLAPLGLRPAIAPGEIGYYDTSTTPNMPVSLKEVRRRIKWLYPAVDVAQVQSGAGR